MRRRRSALQWEHTFYRKCCRRPTCEARCRIKWHVETYSQCFDDLVSVLEFAAKTTVNSDMLVDTVGDALGDLEVIADPGHPRDLFLSRDVIQNNVGEHMSDQHHDAVSSFASPCIMSCSAWTTNINTSVSLGHCIVQGDGFCFCKLCAKYAQKRLCGLPKPCRPPTEHDEHLRCLWDGINPSRNTRFR